jgi:hypothetical protein
MPVTPQVEGEELWRWLDGDPESDPTVFVPCVAHLEPREPGGAIQQPALLVSIDDRDAVLCAAGGEARHGRVPLASIGSGRVDIRPVPADWERARARYPRAYEVWRATEARDLFQTAMAGGLSAEDLAGLLQRPPAHITIKLARVRALVQSAGGVAPRAEPAPYHRHEDRVDGEYVVEVRAGVDPLQVASLAGVRPDRVLLPRRNAFCAALTDEQLRSLRADPYVDAVEDRTRPDPEAG